MMNKEKIVIPVVAIFAVVVLAYMKEILTVMPDWNAEIFIAIVLAVIAGCALWVATWQVLTTREHNRLSVEPHLARSVGKLIDKDNDDGTKSYIFSIVNCGVGPAFIKKIELSFDGETIACNNYEEYKKCLEKIFEGYEYVSIGFLFPDSALEAGGVKMMWRFNYHPENDDISFLDKLRLKVKYQSIYKGKIYPYDSEKEKKYHGGEPPITAISESKVEKAKKLARIYAACFGKAKAWNTKSFVAMLEHSNALYTIHDCGFAFGKFLDDKQAELHRIAVIPHEQGRGFGHAVLNDFIAEARARGAQSVFLEVAKDNAPALHLYEKAGFKRIGLRPAYYKDPNAPPIDAIAMRLDIET